MSITTNLFVHDTNTISIKKCKAGEEGRGCTQDSWDIIIEDKEGHEVKVYCWGDDAKLKIDNETKESSSSADYGASVVTYTNILTFSSFNSEHKKHKGDLT